MSIIITGLEMPMERESFNLTIKYNGTVLDTETGMQVAEAYELPPHGRLIESEYLYNAVEQRYRMSSGIEHRCERDLLDVICDAPTIIEAEEGE